MQNRYTGDIGDFAKYGLLRAIRGRMRLGVAWYLHPGAGPDGDGGHVDKSTAGPDVRVVLAPGEQSNVLHHQLRR